MVGLIGIGVVVSTRGSATERSGVIKLAVLDSGFLCALGDPSTVIGFSVVLSRSVSGSSFVFNELINSAGLRLAGLWVPPLIGVSLSIVESVTIIFSGKVDVVSRFCVESCMCSDVIASSCTSVMGL